MGCTPSSEDGFDDFHHYDMHGYHSTTNPSAETKVKSTANRIEASTFCPPLEMAGVRYRYAFLSQRGYYPESIDKENQDAYIIKPSLHTNSIITGSSSHDGVEQAFFAIFDGHGKDGHSCAQYAKDYLTKNIADKLHRLPSDAQYNSKAIRQALIAAHVATNEQMLADRRFDTSLSGTGAISILIRDRVIFVSNVGTSRALVITQDMRTPSSTTSTNPDCQFCATNTCNVCNLSSSATQSVGHNNHPTRLVAKALSADHTPYRKDERERILSKYPSRILSLNQMEGLEPIHQNWGDLSLVEHIDEGGDPPRIWAPNGNYPGTPFTRSLGDSVAKKCGVIAEPEILEREITSNDKFLVIASDGIFEFLTNQMIAEAIGRFFDPIDACKAIAQMAYEMWLQYEVRTDNITIIILFIDEVGNIEEYTGLSIDVTGENNSVRSPGAGSISATRADSNKFDEPEAPSARLRTTSLAAALGVGGHGDTGGGRERGFSSAASPGKKQSIRQHQRYQQLLALKRAATVGGVLSGAGAGAGRGSIAGGVNSGGAASGGNSANFLAALQESRPVRRVMSREKRKNMYYTMTDSEIAKSDDAMFNEASGGTLSTKISTKLTTKLNSDSTNYIGTGSMRYNNSNNDAASKESDEITPRSTSPSLSVITTNTAQTAPPALTLNREHSQDLTFTFAATSNEDIQWKKRIQFKDYSDEYVILYAMNNNFLFQHLSHTQRLFLCGLMRAVIVKEGDWVIRQGDDPDRFYLIHSGTYEVRVKTWAFPNEANIRQDMTEEEKDRVGGRQVYIYESGPSHHPGFGELALMYNRPRAASVIALTDGKLWSLDRKVFQRFVLRQRNLRRQIIRIVRKVELLKCLNVSQIQRLTDLLCERVYQMGDYIITQGEPGTAFYLIVSGTCDCTINLTPPVSNVTNVSSPVRSSSPLPLHPHTPLHPHSPSLSPTAPPGSSSFFLSSSSSLPGTPFPALLPQSPASPLTNAATAALLAPSISQSTSTSAYPLSLPTVPPSPTLLSRSDSTGGMNSAGKDSEVELTLGDKEYSTGSNSSANGGTQGHPKQKVVMKLKAYDYFGERALLESKPRAANVIATSRQVKVLYVEKQAFEETLGPLAQILDDDRVKRETAAALLLLSNPKVNRMDDCVRYTGVVKTLRGEKEKERRGSVGSVSGVVEEKGEKEKERDRERLMFGVFSLDLSPKGPPLPGDKKPEKEKEKGRVQSVTIRTFDLTLTLTATSNSKVAKDRVSRFVEVCKLLREVPFSHSLSHSQPPPSKGENEGKDSDSDNDGIASDRDRERINALSVSLAIPACWAIVRESSLLHCVFNVPLVMDLWALLARDQDLHLGLFPAYNSIAVSASNSSVATRDGLGLTREMSTNRNSLQSSMSNSISIRGGRMPSASSLLSGSGSGGGTAGGGESSTKSSPSTTGPAPMLGLTPAAMSMRARGSIMGNISNNEVFLYIAAAVVSALETLHDDLHVVYRAVTPQSIYIDALGRVCLADYVSAKTALYGSERTYTLLDASCVPVSYMAPEQLATTSTGVNVGHSYPVDMWQLGVLLCELSMGGWNPFVVNPTQSSTTASSNDTGKTSSASVLANALNLTSHGRERDREKEREMTTERGASERCSSHGSNPNLVSLASQSSSITGGVGVIGTSSLPPTPSTTTTSFSYSFSPSQSLAIQQRIVSFGKTKHFREIKLPNSMPSSLQNLIRSLIHPDPKERLTLSAVKKHEFFDSFVSRYGWDHFAVTSSASTADPSHSLSSSSISLSPSQTNAMMTSPLLAIARAERDRLEVSYRERERQGLGIDDDGVGLLSGKFVGFEDDAFISTSPSPSNSHSPSPTPTKKTKDADEKEGSVVYDDEAYAWLTAMLN